MRFPRGKPLPKGTDAKKVSEHFVNHYKDHGFVIDADEATRLLGDEMIKQETKEYSFANAVYESLDLCRFLLGVVDKKDMDLVGDLGDGIHLRPKKK